MLLTVMVLLDKFLIELGAAVTIGMIGLIAKYLFINPLDESIDAYIHKVNGQPA
jgi:hypothetical protein